MKIPLTGCNLLVGDEQTAQNKTVRLWAGEEIQGEKLCSCELTKKFEGPIYLQAGKGQRRGGGKRLEWEGAKKAPIFKPKDAQRKVKAGGRPPRLWIHFKGL